jgi:hypothetical protein
MQISGLAEPLDRGDFLTLVHSGEAKTGINASPIDVDGARAALAMIASLLGSGQVQMVPETIEEAGPWIDSQGMFLPVYRQRYGNGVLRFD